MTTESYYTFLSLFRFPVNSNKIIDRCKSSFNKVFDGKNRVIRYVFKNPEHSEIWEDYKQSLKFDWRRDGLRTMVEDIESFMVIDMPREQSTLTPEPYMYLADVNSVIDYDETKNEFEYIFYELTNNKYAFIDNEFYHVLEKGTQGYSISESIPHEYGYCPANYFWADRTSSGIAKSPFTTELTDLDRYVKYDVWGEYLNGYARVPIYWGYEKDCDYSTEKLTCDAGYLKDVSLEYVLEGSGRLAKCPKCQDRRLGVGAFLEIPTPESEDSVDMRPPVGMIEPNVEGLKYNDEDLNNRGNAIFERVTGHVGELIKKESINEEQVLASFEGELTVINRVKSNFEKAQQWAESTICVAKFGDSFVSASLSYGTEFFTHSYSEIGVAYSYGIKNGWDTVILDMLQNEQHGVRYKNDPGNLMRSKIMNHLDPLRHITKSEAITLCDKGLVDPIDYFVKCNMSSLIMRFELEYIDIVEFGGDEIDFKIKIQKIKKQLNEYAKESIEAGGKAIREAEKLRLSTGVD